MKKETGRKGLHRYQGKGLATASLGINLMFTAVKFFLYRYTDSSAMLAEAVHSLTDVIGSLLVLAGIALSEKKSEQFPWGLYKVENFAALFSAGLIFISAYEIAKMIYRPSTSDIKNLDITIVALFLMAIPILLFSRYEAKKARRINSPSLLADAEDWKMDIAPLAVVAVGLIGVRLSYSFMDRIAAFLILMLVVKSGYGILKDAVKSLLDASVDRAQLEAIKNVVKSFPQVKDIISLYARNSGRFIFVDIDVTLSLHKLKDAHAVSSKIQEEVQRQVPFVERVIVPYRPEKKDVLRHAVPLANRGGQISEHFGSAPYVAFWEVEVASQSIRSVEIRPNPYASLVKGKGIELAKLLVRENIDVLFTKEYHAGKGPDYVFSDAGIEVKTAVISTLEELMRSTFS